MIIVNKLEEEYKNKNYREITDKINSLSVEEIRELFFTVRNVGLKNYLYNTYSLDISNSSLALFLHLFREHLGWKEHDTHGRVAIELYAILHVSEFYEFILLKMDEVEIRRGPCLIVISKHTRKIVHPRNPYTYHQALIAKARLVEKEGKELTEFEQGQLYALECTKRYIDLKKKEKGKGLIREEDRD